MRRTRITLAGLSLLAVASFAQAPPKPGPEHKKLDVFLGNWSFEGELKPSPLGPGGKLTGSDRNETLGGFHMVRRYEEKGPMGDLKGVEVFGYDPSKKTGVYSNFDSSGGSSSGTWSSTGPNWTFVTTLGAGANAVQQKCALSMGAGSTSFRIKCDASKDGKTWTPMFEGKWTKSK